MCATLRLTGGASSLEKDPPPPRGSGCMRLPKLTLWMCLSLAACGGTDTGLNLGEERIGDDEAAIEAELTRLTKEITLARRDESGAELVYRFNQPKSVACLDAEFVVEALPAELAVGLFAAPRSYPARLRFANATEFDDREADLRGLSIRVSEVAGATGVGGASLVQDFTLNNYPALFVGTPADFLGFVEATANGRSWWFFLNPFDSHLGSLLTVLRARSQPDSPFAERYFSTTPYRFGDGSDAAVKYSVAACDAMGPNPKIDDENYLRDAIARNLEADEVCLSFLVQFQADPDEMPIEDASVVWSEERAPFKKVAEIRIREQEFQDEESLRSCEAMRFNPWNGLSAHRPLGGINRVRRDLYAELGRFRAEQNAFPP